MMTLLTFIFLLINNDNIRKTNYYIACLFDSKTNDSLIYYEISCYATYYTEAKITDDGLMKKYFRHLKYIH